MKHEQIVLLTQISTMNLAIDSAEKVLAAGLDLKTFIEIMEKTQVRKRKHYHNFKKKILKESQAAVACFEEAIKRQEKEER